MADTRPTMRQPKNVSDSSLRSEFSDVPQSCVGTESVFPEAEREGKNKVLIAGEFPSYDATIHTGGKINYWVTDGYSLLITRATSNHIAAELLNGPRKTTRTFHTARYMIDHLIIWRTQ